MNGRLNYSENIIDCTRQIKDHKGTLNVIFYSRLVLFFLALSLFFLFVENHLSYSIGVVAVTVVGFLFLFKFEIQVGRKVNYLENLIEVNNREQALLNHNYSRQDQGTEFINKDHNYIADLDIFGRKSIFQLLNRTSTFSGRIKLANWLSSPLKLKNKILDRQLAIKSLSKFPEWCLEFIALGFSNKEESVDKDVIISWLNEENYFSTTFLKTASISFPVATLLSIALYFLDFTTSTPFTVLFFTQLIIVGMHTKMVTKIHNQLSRKFDSIEKYHTLISHIEKKDFDAPLLIELKNKLESDKSSASEDIHLLKKMIDRLDARMNITVAIVLNGVLLWDINSMQSIEKWRMGHKEKFMQWIETIGEFDAFISLALYAYNHPNYSFGEVVENDSFLIETNNVGHPMINEQQLVSNNYKIEGMPKVDLLTGANMAGKSTFLRTIGSNLILAMIGAPVCASKFIFTPVLLFTSLRTNDSLQENESFFYAELKRLQVLIEHYKKGEKVFFLLDEILKGTNSKDQHLGAKSLIEKIIRHNGTGIIATHDVELSKLINDYPKNISNLCFEITIENDKLNFDYTIKEGVCRTMNASFLMKKMEITD